MRHGPLLSSVAAALLALVGCAQPASEARGPAVAHPPVMSQSEEPPPGNPAGMMPASPEQTLGAPAPHATNVADRIFLGQAALAGLAEVALGRQAAGRATGGVADFARQMIADHDRANERLAGLAKAAGVALPTTLDPADEAERRRQQGLSGSAFESAYVDSQVIAHQKAAQLLQWELASGQDPALRQFAADQLPIIFSHLDRARTLQTTLRHGRPVAAR